MNQYPIIKEVDEELDQNTEKRVHKMLSEFSDVPIVKLFPNTYKYDGIISQVKIPISAVCEHHEVAFQGFIHIAYIPGQWVTGLSKLARVAEYYLNPTVKTVQEKANSQIINHLNAVLEDNQGIMVVIEATHNCISFRGVKKPSVTITSMVTGVFAEKGNDAKSEFLSLINSK